MKTIPISNHNKFPNRLREVVIESKKRHMGDLFVSDNEIKNFQPKFDFTFRIFYYEIVGMEKIYDGISRSISYTASASDRIGIVNNELKYITDPEFPNYQYFPTELDFLIELEATNQFTIAGQKHSLPKISDGNGGEREMNEDEITELFVTNLDTRESGSFFVER